MHKPRNLGVCANLSCMGAVLLVSCAQTSRAATLAHWRFEGGKPGAAVLVGGAVVDNVAGQGNDLAVYSEDRRPVFTADVPFGKLPQSAENNGTAVDLGGEQDFYTRDQALNTFDFSQAGSNAWTVEMSLRVRDAGGVSRVFGRDGNAPNGDSRGPLQIVIVGDEKGENFDVRAEIFDGSGTFRDVVSLQKYPTGKWLNLAITADKTALRLYIDALDGRGYQMAAEKEISGALSATLGGFSVGRGWNNAAADRFTGKIDEVRLSDTALSPSQFLFADAQGRGVVGLPSIPEPKPKPLGFPLFYGADPHVANFGGKYWMYMTGRDSEPGNPSFFAYSSPDRKNWTETGPILQFKGVPWIMNQPNRAPWAPGIVAKNGKYYLHYSVGPQSAQSPARIGVAVASSPAGPFQDKGAPLLSGGNGFEAIDAMVFNDAKSGKSYLYAGGSAGAKLRVFEMAPDLLSLGREIPTQTPPQFTEGAFMHERNGLYYLSYSHGYYGGSSYSVHYATGPSPLGPWTYKGPILQSDDTRLGPGHHSFVRDPKTKAWFIAYHRWQSPSGRNPLRAPGRSLAFEPLRYAPNGDILPITQTDDFVPVLLRPVVDAVPGARKKRPEMALTSAAARP